MLIVSDLPDIFRVLLQVLILLAQEHYIVQNVTVVHSRDVDLVLAHVLRIPFPHSIDVKFMNPIIHCLYKLASWRDFNLLEIVPGL